MGLCAPLVAHPQANNDPAALWSQATLYRDEWGVPHVYADNLRAMAFAFGYAQADDHLETMLLAYRAANGRLAEVYGERYAQADEFAVMMGHADLAQKAYANLDFATRDLCEGFALGVNHWLVQHYDQAPAWAEGVQPTDVLAFMHYYLMSQAPFDYERRSRRPAGTPSGNAWAVAPERSASGEAMLVINPHTAYDDLFQWYEAHLVADGMDIAGATLYGLPVILQGHNAKLGWGLTPNEADFADVYVENKPGFRRSPNAVNELQQAAETAYMLKTIAETKPYYVRTNDGLKELRAPQQMTPHGPVVAYGSGRPIAWRTGGYGDFGAFSQLLAMAKAENLAAFQAALTMHQLPCFHVVYADQEGNIFYLYNAKVGQKRSFPEPSYNPFTPPAKSPWDGPLSSIDTAFQWGPVVPPAYLPFQANPDSGFVQACATPPWHASGDMPEWNIDGLRWLVRDNDSYRAKRVRQLLSQGQRSFDDMQSMLFDPMVPFAVEAVPFLLSLADEMPEVLHNGDPDLPAALDMLRDWNHLAEETSTAMTLFHVWWLTFKENSPAPIESDQDAYRLLKQPLPQIKEYALRALSEAVERVRNQFQTINVPWGEVNQLWRGRRSVPVGGGISGEPVLLARQGPFRNDHWPVTLGYGYGMAVKFGRMPEAVSVVPFGASENPESPHYRDQMELFADRQMKETHFAREAVERAARTAWGKRMVFRPGDGAVVVRVQAQQPVEARVVSEDADDSGIPPSLAEFSYLVGPEISPNEVSRQVQVEFTIPEALCARNNLNELGIYGYDPASGWNPLSEQRLDWDSRTFIGRLRGNERVAVLGPARLRRGPVMLASAKPSPVAAPSPIVPVPSDYTPLHERAKAEAEAARASGDEASANATPNALTTLSERAASGRSRGQGTFVFETEVDAQRLQPETPSSNEETAEANPDTAKVAQAPPERASNPSGVQWSDKPLKELVDPRYRSRHSLYLVPENAVASPLAIGKSLELRPPVPGALFRLTMKKTVRAQVQVLQTPPVDPPPGLVPFTYTFSVKYDSRRVRGHVAVSIQVEPGVCAAEDIPALKLYAYDVDTGWEPVEGQKVDASARSFSTLDFRIRTYVVLGPAEYRK